MFIMHCQAGYKQDKESGNQIEYIVFQKELEPASSVNEKKDRFLPKRP